MFQRLLMSKHTERAGYKVSLIIVSSILFPKNPQKSAHAWCINEIKSLNTGLVMVTTITVSMMVCSIIKYSTSSLFNSYLKWGGR